MRSNFGTIITVALIAFCSVARAQFNFTTNWNPTGEGCVDTTGFLTCYDDQAAKASSCTGGCESSNTKGSSEYNTCVNDCERLLFADNIGCWLQSCWNQVYSCGYQLAAMSYFDGNGLVQNSDVPFYPPPDDASAGACSCNIGYVYGNFSAAGTPTQSSDCEVIAGGDNSTLYPCECCELSWPISNILTACPKSDLSVIGFEKFIANVAKILGPEAKNCTILNNGPDTCIKDYNFPFVGTMAYNPLSLPTGEPGTEPLSNKAGNAFTVFPSNVNVTLSLLSSHTTTVTPAAFAATAAADPQSITGTSIIGYPSTSKSSTGKSTGTTTASATSATKTSFGMKIERNPVFLSLAAVLVISRLL